MDRTAPLRGPVRGSSTLPEIPSKSLGATAKRRHPGLQIPPELAGIYLANKAAAATLEDWQRRKGLPKKLQPLTADGLKQVIDKYRMQADREDQKLLQPKLA